MVSNFHEIQIFIDFVHSAYPQILAKRLEEVHYKNKPTKSSELPKPRKIRPTKFTNCTVYGIMMHGYAHTFCNGGTLVLLLMYYYSLQLQSASATACIMLLKVLLLRQ